MSETIVISPIVSFLLALFLGLALATLTWWMTRKSGLVPAQERLISTLESNTKALTHQIVLLHEQLDEEKKKRSELAEKHEQLVARTDALEHQLADLLVENSELRKKLAANHP